MSVLQQHGGTRVLQLFCSYAREDREGVRALLDGVRHLRHQVWVDERLSGGQAWWDEILAQLRKCDAMLIAVSPALLESQASALAGAALVPGALGPVPLQRLPGPPALVDGPADRERGRPHRSHRRGDRSALPRGGSVARSSRSVRTSSSRWMSSRSASRPDSASTPKGSAPTA